MKYCIPRLSITLLATFLTPALLSGQAQPAERTTIPVGSKWPGSRPFQVYITDDGRSVFFGANRGDGFRLFSHDVAQATTREIAGLGDTPYFADVSPSGKWLLFGKKGWVYKTPVSGGELSLVYTINNFKAFETDSTFIVGKGANGFWRVKADGSRREEKIASVDSASGAINFGRPSLLPNGKGIATSVGFGTNLDLRKVGVVALPSGKLTIIDEYGINPRYAASGHILYTQGNTLKAVAFDLDAMKPIGKGVTIADNVEVYSNQASQFDISNTGVLVYIQGPSELNRVYPRTLVWVDRTGNETSFDTPAEKLFGIVRMSPNGRYVAAEVGSGLQLFDRQSGMWSVLSEAGTAGAPVWARNSQSVYYSRAGVFGRQSVQPMGAWQEVWRGDQQFWPFSLLADSSQMLGTAVTTQGGLWTLAQVSLRGTSATSSLLEATEITRRNPTVSPDGSWLAYVEKKSGLDHVYVQAFPAGGKPLLVSQGAAAEASEPAWGRTSNELFYRDASHIVSVQLETSPALRVKSKANLFRTRRYYNYLNSFATLHVYDAATDRFLMVRNAIPDLPATDIQVIKNGFALLNRLAPRK